MHTDRKGFCAKSELELTQFNACFIATQIVFYFKFSEQTKTDFRCSKILLELKTIQTERGKMRLGHEIMCFAGEMFEFR